MIEVHDLRKRFGNKMAVDGVSFSVNKGEVLGFLGPNGAGKSTTMRMVTGFFPPTSGGVTIGGADMLTHPEAAKAKIGYLPENAPLYSDMSVTGFLGFCAEIRGLRGRAKRNAVDRVLDMCFLQNVKHQSVDTLSKGYRHRTCFAQSILHDPEVLILDEPTDGLDPNQKQVVRDMIKRMGENKAIIFSTHILEEVEAACSRAIIIDRGRVVADGTPAELKAKAPSSGDIVATIRGLPFEELREAIEHMGAVERIDELPGGQIRVRAQKAEHNAALSQQILRFCNERHLILNNLRIEEGRLDDLFHQLTRTVE